MDFFHHQARARRRTGLLGLYFLLALAALIGVLYLVLMPLLPFLGVHEFVERYHGALWQPALLRWVAILTVGVVALGSLYRIWSLRAGGRAVAEAMGGELLESAPRTHLRRRLLNVVEEMAIASGVPRPAIYVLPDEIGINAFAAGHDWGDAAIAVSEGALRALDRDELQGVVAHEFSHVFHGDMRLNLVLLGLLHGIQVIGISGEWLLRGARLRLGRRAGSLQGAVALLGIALFVVGWAGVFFAGLIKAAISRQREFLADAAAVQYTRSRDGIGGALAKIGGFPRGARLLNPREREVSHFLFAYGEGTVKGEAPGIHWLDRLMSTHPGLEERLTRIYGTQAHPWRDGFTELREADLAVDEVEIESGPEALVAHLAAPAETAAPARTGPHGDATGDAELELDLRAGQATLASLPPAIVAVMHDTVDACALVYGLLIATDPDVMQRQHQHLQAHADRRVYRALWRLGAEVRGLSPRQALALLEVLGGTLITLSPPQYRDFTRDIDVLIEADGRLDTREFAVRQILMRHLDRHFGLRAPARLRHRDLLEVIGPVALTLSTFAWFGHPGDDARARRAFAAGVAALALPASTPLLAAERCTLRALGHAFDAFREALPELRARIVAACEVVIAHDRRISAAERDLLRALRGALELPAPPPPDAQTGAPTGTSA